MSKITKASKGSTCIKCDDLHAYSCHYSGPRQHEYGKGRGIKCNDIMTAEFCSDCDKEFSEGSTSSRWRDKWERSEEFLHWIALTNIRRLKNGVLKV